MSGVTVGKQTLVHRGAAERKATKVAAFVKRRWMLHDLPTFKADIQEEFSWSVRTANFYLGLAEQMDLVWRERLGRRVGWYPTRVAGRRFKP